MDELKFRSPMFGQSVDLGLCANGSASTNFPATLRQGTGGTSVIASFGVAGAPAHKISIGRVYALLRCCLLAGACCLCVYGVGAGQAKAAQQAGDDGENGDVASAMTIVVAKDRSCCDRQAALASCWNSQTPELKMSGTDAAALARIVRDEEEPFELRADIVHTMTACGAAQPENDCSRLLLQLMDDSLVDRRIRLLAAVALTRLPNSIADIDDIVTVVLNCSNSDIERSDALEACFALVIVRPGETGEWHRRMLLIALSDSEGEPVRIVALGSFLNNVDWISKTENRRDLVSTQGILIKISQDRSTADSIRSTAIDLANILLLLDSDSEKRHAELRQTFANFLVTILTDPTESVEVQEHARNAIITMLPFIDAMMVTRLANMLESDGPKGVQKSVIATLESLKSLAAPSIPTLEAFSTQTSDIELRTAAKKAIASISSETSEN